MDRLHKLLLKRGTPTYGAYYNGDMSYTLHGADWAKYVVDTFPNIKSQKTSENVFKTVIDLYGEHLLPDHEQLHGLGQTLVPLLIRGEAPVLVDNTGTAHYPEHYEMISDGGYTLAAVFTRSLRQGKDYVTFIDTDGHSTLWAQDTPDDLSQPESDGYSLVEETSGHTLLRLALPDRGMGATLAALQDRINHSIIDQTVVAEMYARPFWYLLNVEAAPKNPYLPAEMQPGNQTLRKQKADGSAGRIFTSSSAGPFGQLEPPTIGDMVAYHDSIVDKVSQTTGIPQFYFKPGGGTPPTGIALKTMTKRFLGRVSTMRTAIAPQLLELADLLGIAGVKEQGELWSGGEDLLQDSLDAHGISLAQMGYPLEYVASVVTPGVNLDEYGDDGFSLFNQAEVEEA